MSTVGQIERKTQQRVVKLLRAQLGYAYRRDWTDREGNANIEPELLRGWLTRQGVENALITRALHILEKAAGDTSKNLYDRNRAVYELLRYGTIQTPEKYYLTWKEKSEVAQLPDSPLDRALIQLCGKARFLELIHDFILFDAGTFTPITPIV